MQRTLMLYNCYFLILISRFLTVATRHHEVCCTDSCDQAYTINSEITDTDYNNYLIPQTLVRSQGLAHRAVHHFHVSLSSAWRQISSHTIMFISSTSLHVLFCHIDPRFSFRQEFNAAPRVFCALHMNKPINELQKIPIIMMTDYQILHTNHQS